MSELGDSFREFNKMKQGRRAQNRAVGKELLSYNDIIFTSHNDSAHLIVDGVNGCIDFWPGTGLWIDRQGERGRGIKNLIIHINGEFFNAT